MKKLNVFLIDDSAIYRTQIRTALMSIEALEVVGSASNGRIALENPALMSCDVIILDLEMPEMDGLQTLVELKKRSCSAKTILFSSTTRRAADITLEALNSGAFDFIAKPGSVGEDPPHVRIQKLLAPKIEAIRSTHTQSHTVKPTSASPMVSAPTSKPLAPLPLFSPEVIVIGASTGGPTVLEKIFTELKGPFPLPILIAQHMPPVFTASLAQRLGRLSQIPSSEAKESEVLEPNRIYVAPGNFHMRLEQQAGQTWVKLDQGPLVQSVRPAVDPLFESAAKIYGSQVLGIILTGMGRDGADGAIAIKKGHGNIVIQKKETCVVFGMPGAVFDLNVQDAELDPMQIVELLKDISIRKSPKLRQKAGASS